MLTQCDFFQFLNFKVASMASRGLPSPRRRRRGRTSVHTGCSKILEKGQATAVQSKRGYEQLMDSFVGTKVYAAPEILRHKPYDATVDEYSTGVLARSRRPAVSM